MEDTEDDERRAQRQARLEADPEYQEALAARREKVAAARRDGTPEPPHIRRDPKTGDVVEASGRGPRCD